MRAQVEQMDRTASADDQGVQSLIRQCRKALDEAKGLAIEDDYGKAMDLLARVERDIKPFLEGREIVNPQVQDLRFLDVKGDVKVKGKEGVWRDLGGDLLPAEGITIKTGIRSSVRLSTFSGSILEMPAQSILEWIEIDAVRRGMYVELRRGFFVYDQKTSNPILKVRLNRQDIVISTPALAEFGNDNGMVYCALHRGSASCEGMESRIMEGEAWILGSSTPRKVGIPQSPVADSPANHQTFGVDPETGKGKIPFRWHTSDLVRSYQLQVATTPDFTVREYDDTSLTGGSLDLDLETGIYFWRVRGISQDRVPGAFSSVGRFDVENRPQKVEENGAFVRKPTGPAIRNVKVELISGQAIVSGRTSPDAVVTINGVKAIMEMDGRFSVIVSFMREGEQWVEIIARNAEGQETQSRHLVKVRF